MNPTPDILIIGGGVIGLTTAYHLAQQGVSVTVVDRQEIGREASWAGAGMLPPGHMIQSAVPEVRLRSYSHSLWDELSAALKDRTGIDNGYRRCGAVEVGLSSAESSVQVEAWRAEGLQTVELDRTGLERHVPDLHEDFRSGVFLPEFGQARNPRHLKALAAACHSLGVDIVEHAEHLHLATSRESVVQAVLPTRTFTADRICITAGSWSSQLLQPLSVSLPVQPVRGQIVLLKTSRLPFSCVIEQGRRYIVPRADGLVLVGSTEEHTGFEKKTTAEGVSGLLKFASALVPELGAAEVVRCWAGLRPGSPDELPFLGRVPEFENLFVGAGHFRSGLQMSAGTGRLLADLLLDHDPAIDLSGLTMARLSTLH